MKTLNEVTQELDDLLKSIKKDSSEREIKSAKSRAQFLRMCIKYLETCPREEFIRKQLNEAKHRVELIPTHFESWKTGKVLTQFKDPYAAYCTQMGLSTLKIQVVTLEYLLN